MLWSLIRHSEVMIMLWRICDDFIIILWFFENQAHDFFLNGFHVLVLFHPGFSGFLVTCGRLSWPALWSTFWRKLCILLSHLISDLTWRRAGLVWPRHSWVGDVQHPPGPLPVARVRGVHLPVLHRAHHHHRNPVRTHRTGDPALHAADARRVRPVVS